MRKNWTAIANLRNKELRHNLIAAKGDIARRLAQGFPECFLNDEDEHPHLVLEELLNLVVEMRSTDEVVQACKDAGLPYKWFAFSGSCEGVTNGVPYSHGGHYTVGNGWGSYFWRCTKKRGETLEYEDIEWVVIWNGGGSGTDSCLSWHSIVIVSVEALSN